MSIKKHRNITVNNIEYAWLIRNGFELVIFKDKKIIFEYEIKGNTITPKTVANIINAITNVQSKLKTICST